MDDLPVRLVMEERTTEPIDDLPVPQVMEDRTQEQIDHSPVPQVVEGILESVGLTPQERMSERTVTLLGEKSV